MNKIHCPSCQGNGCPTCSGYGWYHGSTGILPERNMNKLKKEITPYIPKSARIYVGIVGSRTFDDYEFLCKKLSWVTYETIVSGGAKGADFLGKKFAKENNLPYIEFPAKWKKHGKSAGYKRNIKIVDKSDLIIAFWDGQSKGTKHTIDIATKTKTPIIIYEVD